MFFSGIADEAADGLAEQLRVIEELGWECLEARSVDGVNIHDLSPEAFERAVELIDASPVRVNCFASTIANWGCSVRDDFADSLARTDRAVERMRRLGASQVRIMSYAVLKDDKGGASAEQLEAERFRRLREICARFLDAGLQPLHENCKNYGGMSWRHTLRMLENVPGLKLVFDTGNPPLLRDYGVTDGGAVQSSWEFYRQVREHVAYVHIKDARLNRETGAEEFFFPGEGDGDVARILEDLLASGYDGGISIEPHMAVVFHDASVTAGARERRENFIAYGRKVMDMLAGLGWTG